MGGVFFFIGVGIIIFLVILMIDYEKQKIRNSAEANGWIVLKISYSHQFSTDGPRRYNVDYKDDEGHAHTRYCYTSLFGAVDWD